MLRAFTPLLRSATQLGQVWLCTRTFSDVAKKTNDDSWKKWKGADEWKNWVDWESKYRSQSDELNRKRHYFWYLDAKGRLLRRELHEPERTFGQMREAKILDYFFTHLERNRTGEYLPAYPYLSVRMHEHYFLACEAGPIVFTDLRHGRLHYAASLSVPLSLESLRLDTQGRLFHEVTTKAMSQAGDKVPLLGYIESTTAQPLLEAITVTEGGSYVLSYEGREVVLGTVE
eukprot:comp20095_c0_seq1/m.24764 comp20095_c0_seq1/g.24764  ORF comp20095_c0_seq1/g.24764 comp20095_c0_seq1/m.24764 type:complete len:230 (-) comp20095_c0_seq1:60-749(-)